MFTNHICLIYINKPDLALNNQQWLICQPNPIIVIFITLSLSFTCFYSVLYLLCQTSLITHHWSLLSVNFRYFWLVSTVHVKSEKPTNQILDSAFVSPSFPVFFFSASFSHFSFPFYETKWNWILVYHFGKRIARICNIYWFDGFEILVHPFNNWLVFGLFITYSSKIINNLYLFWLIFSFGLVWFLCFMAYQPLCFSLCSCYIYEVRVFKKIILSEMYTTGCFRKFDIIFLSINLTDSCTNDLKF